MKYTEKDFQDYLTGNFAGNKETFENWLAKNPEARKALKQYDNLFEGLKSQPDYKLPFSLEDRVMQKLQSRVPTKTPSSYFLSGTLIVAFVAALVVGWRMADFGNMEVETGLFTGAAILTVCFAAALHLVELNRRRERFKTLV